MSLTILIADDDLGTRQILQSEYRASLLTEVRPYLQPPSAVAAQNNALTNTPNFARTAGSLITHSRAF